MTTKERMLRMFEHKEADRVPIIDDPWNGTLHRWHQEGLPANVDWRDFFGVDKMANISINITPRYEEKVLEETDTYRIYTTSWGVTMKSFKEMDSTPEFLDFKITTPERWEEAKKRMTVSDDRIPWDMLKRNYPKWVSEDYWIRGMFWFGFDVTHSWTVGTETFLIAMYEEPEWVMDMFNTYLDLSIAHFDKLWDAGYHFDTIFWYDDMGYKNNTFFSNQMYRELLKPVHKRAVEWAHNKGIYASLHSCGDIMTRVDDLVDIGIDSLNPLEIKAGMDPIKLKKDYGEKLVLHGGINAVLWDDRDAIIEEIRRLVPVLKENGGFVFSSDHSIPNSVSLENFKAIVEEVKKVGKY